MNTQIYPTDLTDSQWDYIKELIPAAKKGGRPRTLDMRQVLNGILYVTVGDIQWRMLPKSYPNWKSVYDYFRSWRKDGSWKRIHDTLRSRVRERAGRHKHATAASLSATINPPTGQTTPYFVKVVQADGHMAWASPIYVRRPA